MAVGPDASGSVIALIIDASIPAGAGHAATDITYESGRGGEKGGMGATRERTLSVAVRMHQPPHTRTQTCTHMEHSRLQK